MNWLSERSARRWLTVFVGLWAMIFAGASIYKLRSFWMGFDLGTHEQVLWNTVHGRLAASSPTRGTTSYFGVDIILTELLIAPIYALWQRPETLLIIQSVVASLGAIPLYRLGRDRFVSPAAGLGAATIYLLSLPLQYATLYEFQIRLVGTTAFLWAFWALEQRRGWSFMLWAGLALGTRFEAGFALAGMGVYAAIHRRGWRWSIGPIAAGLGWVALTNLVLIPAARTDHTSLYTFLYGWMGATPTEMLKTLVTRPGFVAAHVFTAGKMEYLAQLLGPLLFLCILRPDISLIALPSLALNLLSPDRIHWSIRYHYQAFVIPWIIVGTVYAAADLHQRFQGRFPRFGLVILGSLVAAGCVANLVWRSPLQTLLSRSRDTARIAQYATILQQIPADAPVAASSQFGPFLARREGYYFFPGNIIYPRNYIERAHWILVDRGEVPEDCLERLRVLQEHPSWQVEYDRDNVVLLKNLHPAQPTTILESLPNCAVEPEGAE